jgi:transposase
MPAERLSMRQCREILRQKLVLQRPHRAIASSVGVSLGVVSGTLSRAQAAGVDWAAVEGLDDAALEGRLHRTATGRATGVEPDCAWIHRERQRPGVTLELLHHEYLERHPDGLRYTPFCDRYRDSPGRRGLVMRQRDVAGDKLFVDNPGRSCTTWTRRPAR